MNEIVDLSGAEIAVRVSCSLVQTGLVFSELLPLTCPDLGVVVVILEMDRK